MRFIKAVISACTIFTVLWVGFLAIRSLQLEGASLKTCVLISGPFLIWLAYQSIDLIIYKLHSIEDYKSTIKRMQVQIDFYSDMERAVGGGKRLMKCIKECRQSALAIKNHGMEDTSLTLSRLAYIERLLNDIAPTLLRGVSERERQMWERVINELPVIQANTVASAEPNINSEPQLSEDLEEQKSIRCGMGYGYCSQMMSTCRKNGFWPSVISLDKNAHFPSKGHGDTEESRIPQLSSKAAEEINCLKKTTSAPNEMSDWQDLAASLERRVDEQH